MCKNNWYGLSARVTAEANKLTELVDFQVPRVTKIIETRSKRENFEILGVCLPLIILYKDTVTQNIWKFTDKNGIWVKMFGIWCRQIKYKYLIIYTSIAKETPRIFFAV